MFGFSFSELVVVVVVALVVIGPKDLPKMLRRLGKWAGQLRRMASDLRAQSGIDEALRTEGLTEDINEIRKLARGELDSVRRDIESDSPRRPPVLREPPTASAYLGDFYVDRAREYPRDGADAHGALPDNAIVYADGFPRSKHGDDPLYMTGDPNGVIPADPPKPTYDDEREPAADADADADPGAAADAATAAEPAPAEPAPAPAPGEETKADEPPQPHAGGEAR